MRFVPTSDSEDRRGQQIWFDGGDCADDGMGRTLCHPKALVKLPLGQLHGGGVKSEPVGKMYQRRQLEQ